MALQQSVLLPGRRLDHFRVHARAGLEARAFHDDLSSAPSQRTGLLSRILL